jgi:hypothetical protein
MSALGQSFAFVDRSSSGRSAPGPFIGPLGKRQGSTHICHLLTSALVTLSAQHFEGS